MTFHDLSRRAAAALVLTLALGAPVALAHHGWSGYLDDNFVLTGVVEEIELGQPHGHLMVHAAGTQPPRRDQRWRDQSR
jgi:hypothetical protein